MANSLNYDDLPVIPEELVREILTWLPVKSLMRFKCVSKLWKSIILDPLFAKAYRGGFRGILVSELDDDMLSSDKNLFYLHLFDDYGPTSNSKLLANHHTVVYGGDGGSTEAVNGLVCFYNGNYSCLYNIATRECRDLPLSQCENESCSYHLGFDPVNKLYKLLKICTKYMNSDDGDESDDNFEGDIFVGNLYCEILILGIDMSWRKIDPAPYEIMTRSVCCDGILYWLEDEFETAEQKLIAFHLDREKFEVVPCPYGFGCFYLSRFGPDLTLIVVRDLDDQSHNAAIFHYDDNGRDSRWVDGPIFNLPLVEDIYRDCYRPVGILPDGRVLLIDYYFYGYRPFYLYDPLEKKLTKMVIHLSSSDSTNFNCISGHVSYHEENIISLSCLTI